MSGEGTHAAPSLSATVETWDSPLRLMVAIAARAAAVSRLPADARATVDDAKVVAEDLSAFKIQDDPLPDGTQQKAGSTATDEEIDEKELHEAAKAIAAASKPPELSEAERQRERERQQRSIAAVEAENQSAARERRRVAKEWADEVARHCKLDPDVLPPNPRSADLKGAIKQLQPDKHLDILHDLLLISMHLPPPTPNDSHDPAKQKKASKPPENAGIYTPLARYLLYAISQILNIPSTTVQSAEKAMAQQLYFVFTETKKAESEGQGSDAASQAEKAKMKQASQGAIAERDQKNSTWKWAATGAGFILGGVAIGVTGGLAAPLVAPLLVTATGGALSFLATSGGAVLLGTMFGLTGGGLTAFRAKRRMEGIEEFEFEKIEEPGMPNIPSLTATLVASGFLVKPEDYIQPYEEIFARTLAGKTDAYAIKAETGVMLQAGRALDNYLKKYAGRTFGFLIGKGISEIIKRTALSAVFSAIALPATVYKTATKALDNDFQRSTDRAQKAGVILADVLEKGVQGNRPTILVGSSLGAVTIMTCLLELHKRNLSGLVYDAILISLPAAPSPSEWLKMRQVTARRLVNAYSSNDWVLAIIARLHTLISTKLSFGVAGLQAVELDADSESDGPILVENVDLSDILNGHLELAPKMTEVLKRIDMGR